MNRTSLLVCFVLFASLSLARNPLDKYGILYVNEILANIDTNTVVIEQSIVHENVLTTDILEEWNGNGINTEGIFLNNGDAFVFDYFLVHPDTTFPGELYANGGIHADKPNEDFLSFYVEDNTGNTSVSGLLTVDNGFTVSDGVFTVAADTGETTIRNANLNANGEVWVNGEAFQAENDGFIFINDNAHFLGTVILGTSTTEDRYIKRVSSPSQTGGNTYFSAQSGLSTGGNLRIIPGIETECGSVCEDGAIFVGASSNGNVRVVRDAVDSTASQTVFRGQFSPNSDGGSIYIAPGDSAASGAGGDLILIPGLSGSGLHGSVYFGTNEAALSDFDLLVQRPPVANGNGGDTYFEGQSTHNGNAGNLNILAGQGEVGGVLRLIPGDADPDSGNIEEQGDIILGAPVSADLTITRSESNTEGGDTFFVGQSSADNRGGDLIIKSGSSLGNGAGGSLHLLPGSNPATPGQAGIPAGNIFLGDLVQDLVITRQQRSGGGLDTYIIGQEGAASQGGDVFLVGGDGLTSGGDVEIRGGDHVTIDPLAFPIGGAVSLEAGDGQIDGGAVNVRSATGGTVSVRTDANQAGNVYLNAGSGTVLGDVSVGDTSVEFIVRDAPVIIDGSYFEIQEGSESLVIRADPTSIVEYNGKTILRSVSDYVVPVVPTDRIEDFEDGELSLTTLRMAQLQNSLEILVNALSQCQHGLFQTLDVFGLPDSCEAFAA